MGRAPENEAKIIKGNKIISQQPHHTTRKQKGREWCREGAYRWENVTFVSFVVFWCVCVFLITRLLKTKEALLSPALLPRLPSLFAGCPLGAEFSKEGQTSRGDKWSHSRREVVSMSGKWDSPRTKACLIFKAAILFQITLSEHLLEIVIFLSFLPAMGFHIPRSITHSTVKRLSQRNTRAGEVHNASPLALIHSGGGKIKK